MDNRQARSITGILAQDGEAGHLQAGGVLFTFAAIAALAASIALGVPLAGSAVAGQLNRLRGAIKVEDRRCDIGHCNTEAKARQRFAATGRWFLCLLIHTVRPSFTLPLKMSVNDVVLKR